MTSPKCGDCCGQIVCHPTCVSSWCLGARCQRERRAAPTVATCTCSGTGSARLREFSRTGRLPHGTRSLSLSAMYEHFAPLGQPFTSCSCRLLVSLGSDLHSCTLLEYLTVFFYLQSLFYETSLYDILFRVLLFWCLFYRILFSILVCALLDVLL